ncbi:hypothetical protein DSO57_1024580 [Entomophthora muscae]|uniref:Uncharacterized protein n=1 Tax=Entomophthora muscae TaxID=34485 RepID=A0ACC2RTL4_9FUNG|nr:hypothetical protein DSO57_1024580 [Entomophthora muscae]
MDWLVLDLSQEASEILGGVQQNYERTSWFSKKRQTYPRLKGGKIASIAFDSTFVPIKLLIPLNTHKILSQSATAAGLDGSFLMF